MREIDLASIKFDHVKGVLIDLDNTLYAYEPAHQAALKASYPVLCDKRTSSTFLSFDEFATRYFDARQHVTKRLHSQGACRSRLFAFQFLCEGEDLSHPYRHALDLDRIYWDVFLEHMKIHPPALHFVDRAIEARLPVCVVTDMTAHVQIRKLERLGLIDKISHLVTSEEVGCEKPDSRMFQAGLNKLKISAENAIMIGDDKAKDIAGAEACGIRAYYLSASGGQ